MSVTAGAYGCAPMCRFTVSPTPRASQTHTEIELFDGV